MTTLDDPPINGRHLPGLIPQQAPNYHQPPPSWETDETAAEVDKLFAGIPTAATLTAVQQRAAQILPLQDSSTLCQLKTGEEFDAEREVAAKHRAQMLKITEERNASVAARERKRLKVQDAIADAEHRDDLDAMKAAAQLRRLSNPVAYLAAQVRARRASLTLAAAPTLVAVSLGSVQSQDSLTRLWHVAADNLVWWLLYGLEPLATLPLIAILLYQAAAPGGSLTSWQELRKSRFFGIEVGLLAASVLINVGPHVGLGEGMAAVGWLAIPAAIVVSLRLVPLLADGYNLRILQAKTEAQLQTPGKFLSGALAKVLRQVRMVQVADQAGEIGGFREHGVASTTQVLKVLRREQGTAGKPDAQVVNEALRLLAGTAE